MNHIGKDLITKEEAKELVNPRIVGKPLTIENLCEVFAQYYSYELELKAKYNYESYSSNGNPLTGEPLAMLPIYTNVQRIVDTCKEMTDELYQALNISARISVKTKNGKRVIVSSDLGDISMQVVENLEEDAI